MKEKANPQGTGCKYCQACPVEGFLIRDWNWCEFGNDLSEGTGIETAGIPTSDNI